jgi:hypothetical protein
MRMRMIAQISKLGILLALAALLAGSAAAGAGPVPTPNAPLQLGQ